MNSKKLLALMLAFTFILLPIDFSYADANVMLAESPSTGDYLMTICWLLLIGGLLAGATVILTKGKSEDK